MPDTWDRLAALMTQVEARPVARWGKVECPPGWHWKPHLRDFDLWLVVRGHGSFRFGEEHRRIQPATLLVLRPGDTGYAVQEPDDRLTVVYVHFDFFVPGANAQASVPADCLPSRYVPLSDARRLESLLTQVVRLLDARRPLAEYEAGLIFKQALLEIYRQDAANHGVVSSRLDSRLEKIVAHLHDHPHDRTTLQQAAAMAGLSTAYFSRLFSREVGTSFRAYAVQRRLERARFLLEETSMSIGEIARSLGYTEVFLFSRQFKQHYGCAPSEVRVQHVPMNV